MRSRKIVLALVVASGVSALWPIALYSNVPKGGAALEFLGWLILALALPGLMAAGKNARFSPTWFVVTANFLFYFVLSYTLARLSEKRKAAASSGQERDLSQSERREVGGGETA